MGIHDRGSSSVNKAGSPVGLVVLCGTLLAGCAGPGGAGAPATAPERPRNAAAASAPAFDIRVACADDKLREMVTRFNDLQRYRAVPDLDAAELARLMALAQRQVGDLLATEGYFSPQVTVQREAAVPDAAANAATGQPAAPAPVDASSAEQATARPVVVIAIEPGPVTRVRQAQVDFIGDIATTQDSGAAAQRAGITSGWGLQPGRRFTQEAWRDAKTAGLRALVERRYPRGRIGASRAEVDAPQAQAKLDVTLDSGPPFYLGAATVEGVRRYPADLPQRLSWLKPGDVYDQQKLVDAQQRLAASGYYDSAYVSIDPDTADPAAAPVHYSVTEAKRYKLQLGVGYRTDSGPRESVDWRDNTFMGTTWRNDTTLRIDPKEPLLQTGLTSLPNVNGWRWNTLARVMQQDDGMLTTNSQTLRAGRMQSAPQYDRSVYLQYDNAVVTGSGTASNVRVGDGAAASVNLSWTGRYFDSLPMPRRGFGLSGSVGLGVTTKGRADPFVRLWGRGLTLIPAGSGGSRFALRAELGALFASAGARVPATYLWRTGGDTTVRGYAYRTIGVHLQQGVIAPGRYLALGSVEYQRPILQRRWPGLLEHVLFVDVGDVANHPNDLRAQVGVGTGLRLITPAGPMELDVAYGVQAHQFRLHMNVGFTF
jgi:translocation and assembly module TamA